MDSLKKLHSVYTASIGCRQRMHLATALALLSFTLLVLLAVRRPQLVVKGRQRQI